MRSLRVSTHGLPIRNGIRIRKPAAGYVAVNGDYIRNVAFPGQCAAYAIGISRCREWRQCVLEVNYIEVIRNLCPYRHAGTEFNDSCEIRCGAFPRYERDLVSGTVKSLSQAPHHSFCSAVSFHWQRAADM